MKKIKKRKITIEEPIKLKAFEYIKLDVPELMLAFGFGMEFEKFVKQWKRAFAKEGFVGWTYFPEGDKRDWAGIAITFTDSDGVEHYGLYLPKWEWRVMDWGYLSHELRHTVDNIMSRRGCEDESEFCAYLTSSLTEKIISIIKKAEASNNKKRKVKK